MMVIRRNRRHTSDWCDASPHRATPPAFARPTQGQASNSPFTLYNRTMANATKDRGHGRNCRATLLLMSAMAVVSLCATVSRAAAEGVGSEEIELEDIAEEIAAFEEEEELAASRMKAEKEESPTPSDNLPPTPVTAPVISNSIRIEGAGHGAHSTREDAHVYHEKVQNIRDNLANKAASWTAKLVGGLVIVCEQSPCHPYSRGS